MPTQIFDETCTFLLLAPMFYARNKSAFENEETLTVYE